MSRYRYDIGDADPSGNRPVKAYNSSGRLVMTGVLTPRRVQVIQACVINYTCHYGDGEDAAQDLEALVNDLADGA